MKCHPISAADIKDFPPFVLVFAERHDHGLNIGSLLLCRELWINFLEVKRILGKGTLKKAKLILCV